MSDFNNSNSTLSQQQTLDILADLLLEIILEAVNAGGADD